MRGIRWFRRLLRVLPSEMREAHGRDMEHVFRDAYAGRAGQRRGALRFWLGVVFDILRVAPRQHCEALAQDVRYALRSFRRSPGFTLTATATIALGIGAATTIFAVVNAVLIRPLPYDDAERVAIVWAKTPEGNQTWLSPPELDDIGQSVPSLAHVAGLTDLELALTGSGAPEQLHVVGASASLLQVFGVRPIRGRGFLPEEDVPQGPRLVLLSEDLWRRRFGASDEVIGSRVLLNGQSHTVLGVLPHSFRIPAPSSVFPARIDAWVPLQPQLALRARDARMLHVLARLDQNASLADVRGQLEALGRTLSGRYPEYRARVWTFEATRFQDDVVRPVRPALLVLLAAVGLVLFISAANVAALLLCRGAARAPELALRVALGATASRLTRQLVTEGVLLALAGGVLGLSLASMTPTLGRIPPLDSMPRFSEIAIDPNVALFALVLSLFTAALFTAAPLALIARRGAANDALRARGTGNASIRAGRMLAAGEVALACIVLTLAVLLSRSFATLVGTDPGVSTANLLTFRVTLSPKYATGASITAFFDRALEEIASVPGVQGSAAVSHLPLSGASLGSTFMIGPGDTTRVDADLRGASPTYFSAVDIAVIEGRGLERSDRADASRVVVVDELFARKAWPGARAIGKKIRWFRQPAVELEVVGVVRAVRHRGHQAPPRETVYRPYAQYVRPSMFITVRTAGDPLAFAGSVAAAMQRVDPDQPLAEVTTMDSLAARSLATPGFGAALATGFAAIALLLTMVGMYGLFAWTVTQRRREIGVRLALGGQPHAIVATFMRDGLTIAAAGLIAGLSVAFIVSRAARSLLPTSGSLDLVTGAITAAIVLCAISCACWIPARRASRISPMESLSAE